MSSIYVNAVEERDRLAGELAKVREELDAAKRRNVTLETVEQQRNAARDRVKWFEKAGGINMCTKIYQIMSEREDMYLFFSKACDYLETYSHKASAEWKVKIVAEVREGKP